MLVYKVNNVVVAGGYEQKGRSFIHGHPIPAEHVCVLLTSAKEDHDAPCVLGDRSENGKLFVGGFLLSREIRYQWLNWTLLAQWFLSLIHVVCKISA